MNCSRASCLAAATLVAFAVACTRPEPGAPSGSAGSSTRTAMNRPTDAPSARRSEPTTTDARPPIDRDAPASFETATFALG